MCLFLTMLLLGPRVAIVFWWLVQPGRWDTAFDSFIWPALGFVFLPWTTLMFVAVAPLGHVTGWDWVWLGLAAVGDFASYSSGGYYNRDRLGYA